jgi:hypothetical protein
LAQVPVELRVENPCGGAQLLVADPFEAEDT